MLRRPSCHAANGGVAFVEVLALGEADLVAVAHFEGSGGYKAPSRWRVPERHSQSDVDLDGGRAPGGLIES